MSKTEIALEALKSGKHPAEAARVAGCTRQHANILAQALRSIGVDIPGGRRGRGSSKRMAVAAALVIDGATLREAAASAGVSVPGVFLHMKRHYTKRVTWEPKA